MSRYQARPAPPTNQVILPSFGRIDSQLSEGLFAVINTGQINDIKSYLVTNHIHANVYQANTQRSPIHVAILITPSLSDELSILDIIKLLVNYQAPIHTPDYQNNWPIHLAITQNYPRIVAYLVSKGAPLDTKDAGGNNGLQVAIAGKSVECPISENTNVEPLITYPTTDNPQLNDLIIAVSNRMKSDPVVVSDLNRLTEAIIQIPKENVDLQNRIQRVLSEGRNTAEQIQILETVYSEYFQRILTSYGQFLNPLSIGPNKTGFQNLLDNDRTSLLQKLLDETNTTKNKILSDNRINSALSNVSQNQDRISKQIDRLFSENFSIYSLESITGVFLLDHYVNEKDEILTQYFSRKFALLNNPLAFYNTINTNAPINLPYDDELGSLTTNDLFGNFIITEETEFDKTPNLENLFPFISTIQGSAYTDRQGSESIFLVPIGSYPVLASEPLRNLFNEYPDLKSDLLDNRKTWLQSFLELINGNYSDNAIGDVTALVNSIFGSPEDEQLIVYMLVMDSMIQLEKGNTSYENPDVTGVSSSPIFSVPVYYMDVLFSQQISRSPISELIRIFMSYIKLKIMEMMQERIRELIYDDKNSFTEDVILGSLIPGNCYFPSLKLPLTELDDVDFTFGVFMRNAIDNYIYPDDPSEFVSPIDSNENNVLQKLDHLGIFDIIRGQSFGNLIKTNLFAQIELVGGNIIISNIQQEKHQIIYLLIQDLTNNFDKSFFSDDMKNQLTRYLNYQRVQKILFGNHLSYMYDFVIANFEFGFNSSNEFLPSAERIAQWAIHAKLIRAYKFLSNISENITTMNKISFDITNSISKGFYYLIPQLYLPSFILGLTNIMQQKDLIQNELNSISSISYLSSNLTDPLLIDNYVSLINEYSNILNRFNRQFQNEINNLIAYHNDIVKFVNMQSFVNNFTGNELFDNALQEFVNNVIYSNDATYYLGKTDSSIPLDLTNIYAAAELNNKPLHKIFSRNNPQYSNNFEIVPEFTNVTLTINSPSQTTYEFFGQKINTNPGITNANAQLILFNIFYDEDVMMADGTVLNQVKLAIVSPLEIPDITIDGNILQSVIATANYNSNTYFYTNFRLPNNSLTLALIDLSETGNATNRNLPAITKFPATIIENNQLNPSYLIGLAHQFPDILPDGTQAPIVDYFSLHPNPPFLARESIPTYLSYLYQITLEDAFNACNTPDIQAILSELNRNTINPNDNSRLLRTISQILNNIYDYAIRRIAMIRTYSLIDPKFQLNTTNWINTIRPDINKIMNNIYTTVPHEPPTLEHNLNNLPTTVKKDTIHYLHQSDFTRREKQSCFQINIPMIEKIIAKNSQLINIQNYLGDTSLHEAVSINHLALNKLLLSNGAVQYRNQQGLTPLDICRNNLRDHLSYFGNNFKEEIETFAESFNKLMLQRMQIENYQNNIIENTMLIIPISYLIYQNLIYYHLITYQYGFTVKIKNDVENLIGHIDNSYDNFLNLSNEQITELANLSETSVALAKAMTDENSARIAVLEKRLELIVSQKNELTKDNTNPTLLQKVSQDENNILAQIAALKPAKPTYSKLSETAIRFQLSVYRDRDDTKSISPFEFYNRVLKNVAGHSYLAELQLWKDAMNHTIAPNEFIMSAIDRKLMNSDDLKPYLGFFKVLKDYESNENAYGDDLSNPFWIDDMNTCIYLINLIISPAVINLLKIEVARGIGNMITDNTIIDNVMNTKDPSGNTINNYVYNVLPEKAYKYFTRRFYLNDPDKNVLSPTDLFLPIISLLQFNKEITLDSNSPLINSLNNKFFPWLQIIYQNVIHHIRFAKIALDRYNIMTGELLEMYVLLS